MFQGVVGSRERAFLIEIEDIVHIENQQRQAAAVEPRIVQECSTPSFDAQPIWQPGQRVVVRQLLDSSLECLPPPPLLYCATDCRSQSAQVRFQQIVGCPQIEELDGG